MQSNYTVIIEDFVMGHFIKKFSKKYNNHWDTTLIAIRGQLERIDTLLNTEKAEIIIDAGDIKIIKTQFRIDRTKESAKTSGNRTIVAWNIKEKSVHILLVYSKTDLSGHNETSEWQRLIRDNYPQYIDII